MDNIGTGLELMAVGMTTVFLILLIVINGGKLLIKAVNAFAPEENIAPKKNAVVAPAIDVNTRAVLDEAVKQITGGKGRIAKVTKI